MFRLHAVCVRWRKVSLSKQTGTGFVRGVWKRGDRSPGRDEAGPPLGRSNRSSPAIVSPPPPRGSPIFHRGRDLLVLRHPCRVRGAARVALYRGRIRPDARPSKRLSVHPHVRGRQQVSRQPRISIRFTPTCVGTAAWPAPRGGRCTVHPHVRGDGMNVAAGRPAAFGSPPRAWGRRAAPGRAWGALSVHPHVRGDGWCWGPARRATSGSPPRAWGRRWGISGA